MMSYAVPPPAAHAYSEGVVQAPVAPSHPAPRYGRESARR